LSHALNRARRQWDDIFGTPFSVEVHGSAPVAKAVMKPEGGGIFAGFFQMVHSKPEDPLELRIRNEEGAIEGRMGLVQVQFLAEAPEAESALHERG
jgi:hypothetical protein